MNIRFPPRLTEHLKTLAPVEGVKIVDPLNRATWSIRFGAGATQPQMDSANAALLTFDIPADDAEDTDSPDISKREKAILLTIGLMQGLTPQQSKTQAKLKFKQAMQLLA